MADFDALDGRLRDALGQAAQQGDSAGVADAIRARVAAGDPGTSALGPVAPGWRRRLFGLLLGGIVLGLVIVGGTATGVGLALTMGPAETPAPTATAQALPTMPPSPTAAPTPTASVEPTATTEPVEPIPAPAEPPAPPVDTTAPTVQVGSSQSTVYTGNGAHTTITAVASDAVGVVRVDLAWSGNETGSATMSFAGGIWTYDYVRPGTGSPPTTPYLDFVATALDAAGNAASATVTVAVGY